MALGCWYYRNEKYTPDESNYKYLTWSMYAIGGIAGIVFILVCCCYQAIKIGIAILKTTSQYVRANLRIFLLPLGSYIVIAIWSTFWIGGAACIFSIGNPEPRDDGFPFLTEIKWDKITRAAFFYDVFGLFWVTAFLLGVT